MSARAYRLCREEPPADGAGVEVIVGVPASPEQFAGASCTLARWHGGRCGDVGAGVWWGDKDRKMGRPHTSENSQ